jgi:hypothetical protein
MLSSSRGFVEVGVGAVGGGVEDVGAVDGQVGAFGEVLA